MSGVMKHSVQYLFSISWFPLQVVHRYEGLQTKEGFDPITSLAVTPEDCILAGCHNGCMLLFTARTSAIQTKYNLGAAPMHSPEGSA